MQSSRPFYLNYPPPPVPSRELIIVEGLQVVEQSRADHQWLTHWIERKRISSKPRLTLSDYRQKLIRHAQLLQEYERALTDSRTDLLSDLKLQIEHSNQMIYDTNDIANIRKQIQKRKSKRARLRRQKEPQFNTSEPDHINEQQPTDSKSTQEKIRDIDCVLQTIMKLKQLKQTRQEQQHSETNNDQLTELEHLCSEKLLEYRRSESHSSHADLYDYLFNSHNQSFHQPSNPDAQQLLRAHQNINELIEIRRAWDQYSRSDMSSPDRTIPWQWHEPQLPCDLHWTRYIFDRKE